MSEADEVRDQRARRVVINIPRDLHSDLHSLWLLYREWDLARPRETFAQWLVRLLHDWRKRDQRRLHRWRRKLERQREEEAYAEDARREVERIARRVAGEHPDSEARDTYRWIAERAAEKADKKGGA